MACYPSVDDVCAQYELERAMDETDEQQEEVELNRQLAAQCAPRVLVLATDGTVYGREVAYQNRGSMVC